MRRTVAIFIEVMEAPSRFKKDQRVRLLTGAPLYSTLAGGVTIFRVPEEQQNWFTNLKGEPNPYLVERGWRLFRCVRCVLIRGPPDGACNTRSHPQRVAGHERKME